MGQRAWGVATCGLVAERTSAEWAVSFFVSSNYSRAGSV